MVNWTDFDPSKYQLEFNERKLAAHGIEIHEAAEVLWNGFRPIRNKRYPDRYRLMGRTDTGRPLELVALVLKKTTIRIITGWPL